MDARRSRLLHHENEPNQPATSKQQPANCHQQAVVSQQSPASNRRQTTSDTAWQLLGHRLDTYGLDTAWNLLGHRFAQAWTPLAHSLDTV